MNEAQSGGDKLVLFSTGLLFTLLFSKILELFGMLVLLEDNPP